MFLKLLPGLAAVIGLTLAGCAPSLVVPPQLVAASPAAGARLPVGRQRFELTFNRRLSAEATEAANRNTQAESAERDRMLHR